MNKVSSIYLDILRVLSAFYVFIFHVGSYKIGEEHIFSSPTFNETLGLKYLSAHYFVIVFFVLSGFLITMSASRENISIKSFFISRLGRLYSVLIPALFLSLFTALIIINFHFFPSELIPNNSNNIARIFLNITFLTQSWSLNATPPLNNPFWSISYEFMYYLIMASFLLIKGKKRYPIILIVMLIAGPKVMILFPCWLIGSVVFFLVQKNKLLKTIPSIIFFVITTLLLILILSDLITIPFTKQSGDHLFHGILLFFSWNFLADYMFSLLVALNIFSLFGFSKVVLPWFDGKMFEFFLKKVSNCSYTLYLFHIPIMFLFILFIPYESTSPVNQIMLIVSVLVTVYLIATQTEWKVSEWRGYIESIFEFFNKKFKSVLLITNKKKG